MLHQLIFPYDNCEHRREIANETGCPVDYSDIPELLKDDCPDCLAKEILDLYTVINAPIVQHRPELLNFGFSTVKPEMTRTESKLIFWGLNLIEKLILEHKEKTKAGNDAINFRNNDN